MKPKPLPLLCLLALPAAVLFAGGNKEIAPPAIEVSVPAESAVSPEASPDVQDILYLPLGITAAEKMVVKGFRLVVRDEQERLVRTIEVADTRKPGFFENLLTGIGVKKKIPLEVPEFVIWDGKDDGGRFAPEGRYTCLLEAWDDKGNLGRTSTFRVTVDNTPPQVEVTLPYRIFSPNGDGNQDLLIVEQKGSAEDYWRGVIRDSRGSAVQEFTWEGSTPGNFSWNGRDSLGSQLPDGRYLYEVSARDRAGNLTSRRIENIDIDTRVTTAAVSRDLGWFSPNGDGSKDVLTISMDVPVREGIANWRLLVEDAGGRARRTWTGAEPPPPSVVFDGRDDSATALPQGRYRARLSVLYLNGNNPTAVAPDTEIDLTPPVATAAAEPAIFSPNGDGNKDVLVIRQSSSTEDSWRGEIRDRSGRVVRGFDWRGVADPEILWEGRGDDNQPVADGRYYYVVFTTDRAGNYGSSRAVEIEKDTSEIPELALVPEYREFSPNGDGTRDSLTARVGLPVRAGLERYSLVIRSAAGSVVRRIEKVEAVPDSFTWDGRTDAGAAAPDGEYFVDLGVVYRNGNAPRVTLGPLLLDTAAPTVAVSAPYTLFSPDGDGRRDTITIRQQSSVEGLWEGEIRASGGPVVASRFWKGATADLVWDGKDEEGKPVPDGIYSYTVSAVDRAQNRGSGRLDGIRVDTRPTPVGLTAAAQGFSPNGDRVADEIAFNLYVDVRDGIAGWGLTVRDAAGAAVRSVFGTAGTAPPDTLSWDGRTDSGAAAPDGAYTAELMVGYEKGNQMLARTPAAFALDRVAPTIAVSAPYTLFSPDGDGRRDTLPVQQRSSSEALWEGRVLAADGSTVATRSWKGAAMDFAWDGNDDAGKRVGDGTYSYVVSATDGGGNTGSARIDGILVDTRAVTATLAVDGRGFSPNGDGRMDELAFAPAAAVTEGVSGWTLAIRDAAGAAVRTFAGGADAPLPARIGWDGRTDDGAAAADGAYAAELQVSYEKGSVATARLVSTFELDTTPPTLGITLAPQPFSPDDDGVADALSILYAPTDRNAVESWSVRVLDPQQRLFIGWSGSGAPSAAISWNGLSPSGELVQAAEDYPTDFSATDAYGNTATVRRPIAVDVLVIRDGDRLKIRISSINFAPNSADYEHFDPAAAEKNRRTLDRLAEILKKYPEHQIRIEGHAASEWWDRPAEAAREQREELIPLSLARADAIRGALAQRGIDPRRVTTAGLGGAQPVVPHGDLDNRWKNRRVEFILVRQ